MFASLHTSKLAVTKVQSADRFVGILSRLHFAMILRAERKQLAGFDAARLADIGLTRAQADAEAARPIWDVPHRWRK